MRWVCLAVLAAGCGIELEHDLDERQANQVSALLESAGIAADKQLEAGQSGRFKVSVPRGDVARAFTLLEAHDLPRRGQKGIAESFADSALLPSAVEERARYAAALGAELERTLERVPGVVSARVHLALPAEDPLGGDGAHARPTASVLLKTNGPLGVGDNDVRRLVAGAVHTLQVADVTVVAAGAPAEPPAVALDRMGPVRVAHESRATLAAFATSGLAAILLLSVILVISALRLGSLRKRVRELEKP